MALTTEPTDADILDAADDFRSQYKHGGTTFDEFDALGFAPDLRLGTPQPTQAQVGAVPLPKSYQGSVLTSSSHDSGCRVSFSFGSVAEAEAWHESIIDQHHGIPDGPNGKSA